MLQKHIYLNEMSTTSYDELPYPSLVHSDTSPYQLATLSKVFGLTPPAIETCRVLELGCGDGTNLIAIAQSLPQATCIGIDNSEKQIQAGRHLIQTLKLSNIKLIQQDFTQLMAHDFGQFDYIIAHGFYSWIPPELQDTLLQICQQSLTPQGIIYLSYNVYPGWHMDNFVRDLMRYHVSQLSDSALSTQVTQAKAILRFLANLYQQDKSAFGVFLQEKWQQLSEVDENYLFHDFLETENHPVYFHQFLQHAQQHELTYVTDIEFRRYLKTAFPAETNHVFEQLFQGDDTKRERYLDFVYQRSLRRSLLCHASQNAALQDETVVSHCYIAAFLQPVSSLNQQHSTLFHNKQGEQVEIKSLTVRVAIQMLANIYPENLAFDVLCQQVQKQVPQAISELKTVLMYAFWQLYLHEHVELSTSPTLLTSKIAKYPVASPLARWKATQSSIVINLRCEFVQLDALHVSLLPYLDGNNDLKALRNLLKKKLKKNKQTQSTDYAHLLDQVLLDLAKNGVLMR